MRRITDDKYFNVTFIFLYDRAPAYIPLISNCLCSLDKDHQALVNVEPYYITYSFNMEWLCALKFSFIQIFFPQIPVQRLYMPLSAHTLQTSHKSHTISTMYDNKRERIPHNNVNTMN